ncbi:MAG: hypothetical protein ACK4ME_02415 [Fimbriimonadales bacterium]
MPIVAIRANGQVQIPEEWLAKWGHPSLVVLEETSVGILIRPHSQPDWDVVFSNKLKPFCRGTQSEEVAIERSDLLF